MTFLNASYFWGIMRLPRLKTSLEAVGTLSKATYVTQETTLEEYIETFEPEFLTKLLGMTLYENFIQGMKADAPLEMWVELRNKLFYSGEKQIQAYPKSPCTAYVYYMIKRLNKSLDTIKGNVKQHVSNSTDVNDNSKAVKAWNMMVEDVCDFYKWLSEHDEYKDYTGKQFCPYDFGKLNDYFI